jgi:tetratricopeptide (TPR) repeat protein
MTFVKKWFGFGRDEAYDRGMRAYERGIYEEAIPEFARATEVRDPATARLARFYLAESWASVGAKALGVENYAAAEQAYAEALLLHPNYADLHFQRAVALRGLGRVEEEIASLDRALEINPRYAAAIHRRALAAYATGDRDRAVLEIRRAVEIEPSLGGARFDQGLRSHAEGDHDRALANFEGMVASDARDANAHARLADVFARKRLWTEATEEYANALAIAPRYADVRCRYGLALMELGELDQALEQVRFALEINPNYADAHASTGIVYRRMGREADAREAFRRALEIDPHHMIAFTELERLP